MADLRELENRMGSIDARITELLQSCEHINNAAGEAQRDLNAEEQRNFDKAWGDYCSAKREYQILNERIEQIKKAELRAELNRLVTGSSAEDKAQKPSEYRAAYMQYLRRGFTGCSQEQRQLLKETRAQSTTDTEGGFLTHTELSTRIAMAMRAVGGVAPICQNIVRSKGTDFLYPMIDDTSVVAGIIGEGSTVTLQDFADQQRTVSTYKYSTRMLVSEELLQDSEFELESLMATLISARFDRGTNLHFTTGNGTSQPQGFVGDAPTGRTTASATAITYQEIIDLLHSVDPSYRIPGQTYFMMHDAIQGVVRKLEDGAGNNIWQQSLAPEMPSTLLGYPVQVNQNMDSTVATNNNTMACGNWEIGYVTTQVMPLMIRRLDELYAENGQVGFVAHMRVGGETLFANATTYAPIKLLTQA